MGLVRGMAKTAVIAGTATHVSNNVSRRQAERWSSDQQAQQAQKETAPAPTPEVNSQTSELEQLADLHAKGIITDEEFNAKKKQILGI